MGWRWELKTKWSFGRVKLRIRGRVTGFFGGVLVPAAEVIDGAGGQDFPFRCSRQALDWKPGLRNSQDDCSPSSFSAGKTAFMVARLEITDIVAAR